MKTFTLHCEYPAHYSAELTVEVEDLTAHVVPRSMRPTRPTVRRAWTRSIPLTSPLVAEGVDVDPGRSVPDEGYTSVLTVPCLFPDVAARAGYAAIRGNELVDQPRIMVDAVDAGDGVRVTPVKMVRLCALGRAMLAIATVGLSPTSGPAAGVIAIPPHVT